MKTIKLIYTTILIVCVLTGCDPTIHRYPNPQKALVILQLNVDRNPPRYHKEVLFDKSGNTTINDLPSEYASSYNIEDEYEMRIIVDVMHNSITDNNTYANLEKNRIIRRIIYSHKDQLPPQDTVHIHVPNGNYSVYAWVDYIKKNSHNDWVYYTDSLTDIRSEIKNYPGNTHLRSTASGLQEFVVDFNLTPEGFPSSKEASKTPITDRIIPVYMERPSARFRLVTTDIDDFLQTRSTIDNYTMRLIYKQYVSMGYNVGNKEPNRFISSYNYDQRLATYERINANESTLLCDYVFTSYEKEDNILIDFIVYDKTGKVVSAVQNITVPLKRNHETIIKGSFLLNVGDGNYSIDENFEDEYIIQV